MNISFFGTGLMGFPMAQRLLKSNYQVTVYNRTKEKAMTLTENGAQVADTVDEAVRSADLLIFMVTGAPALEDILFNQRNSADLSGKTVIQMSTISSAESRSVSQRLAMADCAYLEAPVLGSIPQASAGELIVMVGGPEDLFKKHLDLLRCFGTDPIYVGETGKASALKLALNQLIASLTASFAVSLGLVRRNGVDVDIFMDILRKSALYAPTFDKKLDRYLARDFSNPHFPAKHMLKDVTLCIDEGIAAGLDTRVVAAVQKIIEKTLERGLSDQDYSAIYEAIDPKEWK